MFSKESHADSFLEYERAYHFYLFDKLYNVFYCQIFRWYFNLLIEWPLYI